MTSLSIFDQLVMHDFAADVPAEWLSRWAAHGRPVFHASRTRLFSTGDPATRFWLINSGAVVLDLPVPGRGDIVIERLRHGSVLGWSWLIAPYRWRFGALVAEDMHAIEFSAARIRDLIAEDPEMGRDLNSRFLTVLADRLQAARGRLAELYAYPDVPPGDPR
ncbi:Crp/Fnr family transcriptional regulator [Actinoplanes sp. NPDC020271]|uniref:Crp/Fnr family transcriptional regulator n=1 Tax=Actinoplanes sp. NPDC020271 TaxID=3363896 RepID=UPI0037A56A71